jgi:hypothetical protein
MRTGCPRSDTRLLISSEYDRAKESQLEEAFMTMAPRAPGQGDQVFLVDGSSFIFRAYFQSINQDARYNYRSDRLPTGAVRIFCNVL